ncbi:MAG: LPXTG cell wall anchor domain-containing protein [Actinobacteria bacterium]|nr:LPXTG cell wall anchor domain-containing protein [Actinomycetota bacterium]
MKRSSMLLAAMLALLIGALVSAPPVLAQPDKGNSIVVDPPDVFASCDHPPPEYRELCLEKGFTPVEPPKRTSEEEAAIEAAAKAQAEEKAARVKAGIGKKTIKEMAEEKAAAGKKKARLPSTGGIPTGVAALAGLGSLLVVGALATRRLFR